MLTSALVPARHDDCNCDGGVEVCSRHRAQGKNHAHQSCCDGECWCCGSSKNVQANCNDQHVCSNELRHHLAANFVIARGIILWVGFFWANDLKQRRSCIGSKNFKNGVDNAPTKPKSSTGDVNAKGNSRVKASSRNVSSTISASNNHKTNRQSIVLILTTVFFGGCYIQHDEAQHESVDELCKCSVIPLIP